MRVCHQPGKGPQWIAVAFEAGSKPTFIGAGLDAVLTRHKGVALQRAGVREKARGIARGGLTDEGGLRTGTGDIFSVLHRKITEVPVEAQRFAFVKLNLRELGLNHQLLGRRIENFNNLLDLFEISQLRPHQQLAITWVKHHLCIIDTEVGQISLHRRRGLAVDTANSAAAARSRSKTATTI